MEEKPEEAVSNASNISARINLHSLYSQNRQGWFPWIFQQLGLEPKMKVLGNWLWDGALWKSNMQNIPDEIEITLSDVSEGMLRDTKERN